MAYVCDLVNFITPCVSPEGEQEWDKNLDEIYQVGEQSPYSVVAAVFGTCASKGKVNLNP